MSFKKHLLTSQFISQLTHEQQPDKLYKLNATSQNILKIQSSIKKYNRIRCLILDFNYVDKLENINSLFDLRELHLEGNFITKIQGLETCKNLTVLNLAANQVQKIQKIGHLGKLQNLNLSKNKLEKITNLQSLKELKTLNLSCNLISSLDSLPAFSKLQTLFINNNCIEKISANCFNSSSKLSRLDLSSNRIRDCSAFLGKLINIETLNISNNCLERFQTDTSLNFLEQLNLQNNQLQRIQSIGEWFPQLVVLNIKKNMFCSQHDFITVLAESNMLTQIYFEENPIMSKTFQNTLYQLFKFDRINKSSCNTPGTKYMEEMNGIEYRFKTQYQDIEDDEQDRKIKMSGFYNDQLQNRMTGIKPHRAMSPATKKAKAIINDNGNDIQKNYKEFIQNDRRIKSLREVYQQICEQNNIEKPFIQPLKQQDESNIYLTEQQSLSKILKSTSPTDQKLHELRLRNDTNQKVMSQTKKDKQAKWAELKARTKEKSFNIRKSSRTKQVNSSLSKVSTELKSSKVSNDLMKTQLNPRKPLSSVILQSAIKTGSTFYRPSSQKKIGGNQLP